MCVCVCVEEGGEEGKGRVMVSVCNLALGQYLCHSVGGASY